MKFKIKFADQIVGTLSILAIAALVFIIFFIGSKQKWFVPKHNYYTTLNSASGVSEGMGINYKGFTVGKLTKIELTEEDNVRVGFYISDEYIKKCTAGTIIELAASPIGLGTSCTLHPGNGTQIIPDDSFIPERSSPEAKLLIENAMCSIPENSDGISSIINTAMGLVTHIDNLIVDLNDAFTAKTGTKTTETGEVVEDPNSNGALKDILLNVDYTLAEVTQIMSDLEALTAKLSDPQGLIPKLLESEENKGVIDQLFTTINTTMSDVNGISTSVSEEIPQISVVMAQVQIMLQQIQDVLEGVKNNPLIKNGVPVRTEGESSAPKVREDNF